MKKEDLRIVYMGTPDFAVESLRCLVEGGYNVVGVITMPDKPAGRGHKLQFSPVKQYALEHSCLLYTSQHGFPGCNLTAESDRCLTGKLCTGI